MNQSVKLDIHKSYILKAKGDRNGKARVFNNLIDVILCEMRKKNTDNLIDVILCEMRKKNTDNLIDVILCEMRKKNTDNLIDVILCE